VIIELINKLIKYRIQNYKVKIWIKRLQIKVTIFTLYLICPIEMKTGGLESADVWGDQDDVSYLLCHYLFIPISTGSSI